MALLFHSCCAGSLAMVVATGVLYARSYFIGDAVIGDHDPLNILLVSRWGRIEFRIFDVSNPPAHLPRLPHTGWTYHRFEPTRPMQVRGFRTGDKLYQRVGAFEVWKSDPVPGPQGLPAGPHNPEWGANVPHWGVAVVAGVLPAVWGVRRLRRIRDGGRLGRGLCPGCGYDLRGNVSSRCPECGAAAPGPTRERAATVETRTGIRGS